uniref:Putative loa-3 dper n=1 Tax=Xenopsylla cheopis TaxID=163159 RepID=A0A6M2DZH5_XENCH
MWIMVINDLLVKLARLGVYTVGYADDVALLVRGNKPEDMHRKMQRALNLIEEWCCDKSLKVNPNKTEMVLFTKKRKLSIKAPSIFNTMLGFSSEVRYLGVTLDHKLNWKHHINKQVRKATATFWACRKMFGQTWGLKPIVVRWIYTAILVPQLTYASVVWWIALCRKINTKALNKVYRLAMLGITGAMRTTPTLAMGALLNIKPPSLYAEFSAIRTAIRLQFAGSWKTATFGHATVLRNRDLDEVLALGGDRCPSKHYFRTNFSVIFPEKQDWKEESPNFLNPKGLVWYTDGSKTLKGTGAAFWSDGPKAEATLKLGPSTTIFQAEVYTIWACANHIKGLNHRNKHIYICSDSRSALMSVVVTSKVVRDCIELLEQIAATNTVKLVWTPAHCGIHGNEVADSLDKSAACNSSNQPICLIPASNSFIKGLIDKKSCSGFLDMWLEAEGMRHTKALFQGPSKSRSNSRISLDRAQLRLAIGLITGHWITAKHLTNMGIAQNALCLRSKSAEETPLHVLTECEPLLELRKDILGADLGVNINIMELGVGTLQRFAKVAGLNSSLRT